MIKKSLFLGFDKKLLLKFMGFMHVEFVGFYHVFFLEIGFEFEIKTSDFRELTNFVNKFCFVFYSFTHLA